jgi:lysophospholipase L1-like esterase
MHWFRFLDRMHRLIATARCPKRVLRLSSVKWLRLGVFTLGTSVVLTPFSSAFAQEWGKKWAASWTAAPHGPYPAAYPVAQPDLSFALPDGDTQGATNQTFRLIVKPDLWSNQIRLRFSNTFGTQPVQLGKVAVGLDSYAGNIVVGTSVSVTFGGKSSVTIPVGKEIYSDAVSLRFADNDMDDDFLKQRLSRNGVDAVLVGRKLAVSFFVSGDSGPMTWHGDAFATSYITPPNSGDHTADIDDLNYPYTTTSWYLLDAVEVEADEDTAVVCAFGDSITDGVNSTLNGNDRWADDLSRRLHEKYGGKISVVNEAISGNTVDSPRPNGTSVNGEPAVDRLDRDVLGIAGLTALVWLEGINDLGASNATPSHVIAGLQNVVQRLHTRGIKVVGCTITSSLNSIFTSYGTPAVDAERKVINQFIRTSGIYDSVADFDAVTVDPSTGALLPAFQPNSTVGGAGDLLHPNRTGYQAMANAIDLKVLAPNHDLP